MAEVNAIEVIQGNRDLRIDAQYYSKSALEADAKIKSGGWGYLETFSDSIASFGAYDLTNQFSYVEEGVPFLRCVNIKNGFVSLSDSLFVTPEAHQLLYKSAVRPGMVLLTMSGSVGNAAVASPDWEYPINSNQDIAKITTKSDLNPYYLAAFLGSSYGKAQMERLPVGSIQQHIFLWMIEKIIVSRLSAPLEGRIGETVQRAYKAEAESRELIQQAQTLLLSALGLEQWQPPEALTYERSATDVFAAGRVDAEYFAPYVTELLERLSKGGRTVRDVAPVRHERFTPQSSGTFDYIEIGGVRSDGTVEAEQVQNAEAPSRAVWTVREGDVVTSTVRPIRRLSALIRPEQDGFICSSGFVVLEPLLVPTEVLLTYLRLPPVCEVLNLYTSASLYPALSEGDVLNLPFPELGDETQTGIVAAVKAAHQSRTRAAQLLEAAKRAVEIAIEDSEAAALAYLSASAGGADGAEAVGAPERLAGA